MNFPLSLPSARSLAWDACAPTIFQANSGAKFRDKSGEIVSFGPRLIDFAHRESLWDARQLHRPCLERQAMSYYEDREAVARRLEELREALEKLHSTIPLDEARIIEIIEEIRDLTSETGSPFLSNEKGLLARVPQHKRFLPSAAA
jgi:hypothetical protein